MIRLQIKTVAVLDDGCFSVLLWDNRPFAVSVERTHADGQPTIPSGIHECVRDFYHGGGYETFEILIDGHDRVLFHKGNTELDSEGCVCVAEKFSTLEGKLAVLESREGFAELMEKASGLKRFLVEITGR